MGCFQPQRPRDVSREKLMDLARDVARKESAYRLLAEQNRPADFKKRIDAAAELAVAQDEWSCARSIYHDAEREYSAGLRLAALKGIA